MKPKRRGCFHYFRTSKGDWWPYTSWQWHNIAGYWATPRKLYSWQTRNFAGGFW